MPEIQKKIELLQKIAHRFNEANIEWALGASMLLYFKGIISEFHDIDLMVSVHDAEQVRTILSEMGELHAPASASDPMSVDIDVMAGFSIVSEGKVYDCSLDKEQIVERMTLGTEIVPLQSLRLWCKYYRLMGRNKKADMIENNCK